jgi:hypothetical protein
VAAKLAEFTVEELTERGVPRKKAKKLAAITTVRNS